MTRKMYNYENIIKSTILAFITADVLGVPVEFIDRQSLLSAPVTTMREYGTYSQPKGTWSDDSSMTLATMDSLLSGLNYNDMMDKFSNWALYGDYTPYGEVFDMGRATHQTILRYGQGKAPLECGGKGDHDNGNGSLMRIIPVVLYLHYKENLFERDFNKAVSIIQEASCLTHAHMRSQMACIIYAKVLIDLINDNGESPLADIIIKSCKEIMAYYGKHENEEIVAEMPHFQRIQEIEKLLDADEDEIRSTGYVIDTLEAALWCLANTDSYKECVLKAVNLGDDTDTVAAVAGGLAGVYYGYGAIPEEWLNVIARREWIEELCEVFTELCL